MSDETTSPVVSNVVEAEATAVGAAPSTQAVALNMMDNLRSTLRSNAGEARHRALERAKEVEAIDYQRALDRAAERAKDAPPPKSSSYLSVAHDKDRFVGGWVAVVQAFVDNPALTEYKCPPDLTGYDRKMLHQLAEQFNLGHLSHGRGRDRALVLSKDTLFYEHGGMVPTDERVNELKQWNDMRKDFNPSSSKQTSSTAEEMAKRREYVPVDMEEEIKRNAAQKRRDEASKAEALRRQQLKAQEQQREQQAQQSYNLMQYEQSLQTASLPPTSLPPASQYQQQLPYPVSQYQQSYQPGYQPQPGYGYPAQPLAYPDPTVPPPVPQPIYANEGAEPAAKRRRKDGADTSDPMTAFIQSGLAPKSVKVVRHTPTEPLGIKFTKELLITAVSGACERSAVPTDIFVTEVDNQDVGNVQEFTAAVKGRLTFTLTLWYLRKDGSTVDKLAGIAQKAEAALQAAVEGATITTMMSCTVCESSQILSGDRWIGTAQRPCEACEQITPWVIEDFDDKAEEE